MKISKSLNLIRKNLFLILICTYGICKAEKPLSYNNSALNLDSTIKLHSISNKTIQSSLFFSMGKSYNQRGNFSKALTCLNKALLISENQIDSSKLIAIYNQIAFSLNHAERYDESYIYALKAKHLLSKYENPTEQIKYLINIGKYYNSKLLLNKAENYYLDALELNKNINDSLVQIHLLDHLGELHLEKDQLITAGRYFRSALLIVEQRKENLSYQISNITTNIGKYYSKVNNLDSALFYFNKSLEISKYNNYADLTSASYKALSDLYLNNKDTIKAFNSLQEHTKIQDKLFHSTISQQISELYVQFNSKTKDQQIKLQNAVIKSEQLTKILLITFLLFVSIITVIVFINFYRLKLLNNTLKLQNKKIKIQNQRIKENAVKLKKSNNKLIESKARINKQKIKLEIANEKYIKANSSKDKFFDIIAHDLKSPFQSIMGFSSLLREAYDDIEDKKKKQYIKLIDSSAQHVNSLINNLLNWSRSQNERINLVKTKFDLNKLINEKINLFELTSLKKKINIISSVSEGTTVYGDMNMISLALRNIISNAIKFSYAGGKIEILSTTGSSKTTIYIRDYGIGIPSETIKKLFNIDNSKRCIGTAGENGTGLGLIISKEYIEKNEGTINVMSSIGEGSTFCITLPSREKISSLN